MRKEPDVFGACDRAIMEMNRDALRRFGKLKLAKWDEVHLIRTVTAVYRESARKARQRYYEVAFESYLLAMALCGFTGAEAHRKAEKAVTGEFVDQLLEETDPVTLYRFTTETERKAQRLAEALEETQERNAEIDRALRAWSRQLGQYAIGATLAGMLQAYRDAGVEKVRWVTMRDEKVCRECAPRDGKVFPIDGIPPRHWQCRCLLMPVTE